MNLKYPTAHLILLSFLNSVYLVHAAKILSYNEPGSEPTRMECGKLHFTRNPGCICLNGLWKLFNKCSVYGTIGGDSYCFEPESEITHAVEILPFKSEIAILRSNGDVESLAEQTREDSIITDLNAKDYLVTGSAYTLEGIYGETCVYPQENSYCYYNPMQLIGNKIRKVRKGCGIDVPFHVPSRCVFIKGPKVCLHERHLQSKERRAKEGVVVRSKEASAASAVWLKQNFRRKRDSAWTTWTMGRTFIGAPGQEFETITGLSEGNGTDSIDEYDEDFVPAGMAGNGTKSVQDEILTEVWNYIDHHCQVVLELKSTNELEINYDFPYFKLLHLAKKVMKKICPPAYVDPTFFDLSVNAFIQVLMKRIFYEAPTANYPGYKRIVEALELCIKDLSPYPFITRDTAFLTSTAAPVIIDANATETNGTSPEPTNSNTTHTCPTGPDAGKFLLMNETILEMNITQGFVGLDKDPIIETVWKIFWTSVSACFPHFNSNPSYNDHHRYISWIMSLFETQIVNFWEQGGVDSFTFGGILGNMTDVMTKVAYCAAASRLPQVFNATKYPWELMRPMGETDGGGNGVDNWVAKPPSEPGTNGTDPEQKPEENKTRKRRSVEALPVRCAQDDELAVCRSKGRERRTDQSVLKTRKAKFVDKRQVLRRVSRKRLISISMAQGG